VSARKEIDGVLERDGAESLKAPPDLHPKIGRLRRKLMDEEKPGVRGHVRGDITVDSCRQRLYLQSKSTASVTRLGRTAAWLAATWIGVATVCVVGNAGLDMIAGSSYHRQQYAVAEWLAAAKVGLCRVGSWLFVPGQSQELERARRLLADIRE